MALAGSPATRTPVALSHRNAIRETMKESARRLANIVSGQPDVTDADRIELGLTVRAARTKSAAPTSRPTIAFQLIDGRTVNLTLADAGVGKARSRLPAGVCGAILFRHVGDESTHEAAWQFVALTGQTSIDVTFGTDVPPGAQVWFTAAWFSHRKELGPQAQPASIHLAGGPVMALRTTIRRAA